MKMKMNARQKEFHKKFMNFGRKALEWRRKCELMLPIIARERIWKKAGFSSIYEYAAKLAGLSKYTVDEALRVLRKIEDKPALQKIAEEKGVNRIKPVVTLATKKTEEFWADKAKNMGKHSLETYVRDYRLERLPGKESQPEKIRVSFDMDPKILAQLKNLKGDGTWEDLFRKFLETKTPEKPEAVKSKSRYIPSKIKIGRAHV